MILPQLLNELLKIEKRPMGNENNSARDPSEFGMDSADSGVQSPDRMQMNKSIGEQPAIIDDTGKFSLNQTPFSGLKDMISKSRSGNDTGPGMLRQLLGNVLGGGMVPGTGTVGGDPAGVSKPDHVPGTRQDAALNPQPLQSQPQPNLQPTPLPQPRPDYSQPSALDPKAIEELRMSLLSDSGQLDPNNPNGLSGRMNDPNSQVDMQNQRRESQTIEDSVRGFDGSRRANIQKGNQ